MLFQMMESRQPLFPEVKGKLKNWPREGNHFSEPGREAGRCPQRSLETQYLILMYCIALSRELFFTCPQFSHLQSGNHNIQLVQLVRRVETRCILVCKPWHFLRLLSFFAVAFSCESKKPNAVSSSLFCSSFQVALYMVVQAFFCQLCPGSNWIIWTPWDCPQLETVDQMVFQKGAVGLVDFLKSPPFCFTLCRVSSVDNYECAFT